jgi:hypothetical protein
VTPPSYNSYHTIVRVDCAGQECFFRRVSGRGLRDIKVESVGLPSRLGGGGCSAGVSPAVAGASRARMQEAQPALEERSIATPSEAQEGAGRACPERSEGMPAPQRARRPRYNRWISLTFMSRTPGRGLPCDGPEPRLE